MHDSNERQNSVGKFTKIVLFLPLILLMGADPGALSNLMSPQHVSQATETYNFDDTFYHTSSKQLMPTQTLFTTPDVGGATSDTAEYAACWAIQKIQSSWNCVAKPSGSSSWLADDHWLEHDKYTLDVQFTYHYKIRHYGSVELEIETVQQGNTLPVSTFDLVSSSESYDVEVKASIDFTVKRTYVGPTGSDNYLRNSVTVFSIPAPTSTDVDGDGSYVYLGSTKLYKWDNYAELDTLTTQQTGGFGDVEILDDSITVARVDLLQLTQKLLPGTSAATVAKVMGYVLSVSIDIDLEIELKIVSAVLPFTTTTSGTSLLSSYSTHGSRAAYSCRLGQSNLNIGSSTDCEITVGGGGATQYIHIGLIHQIESEESYAGYFRVCSANNLAAKSLFGLLGKATGCSGSSNLWQKSLGSGWYKTTDSSTNTLLTSGSSSLAISNSAGGGNNNAPVAVLSLTPTSTSLGSTVTGVISGSYDPDGDPITGMISWGDGTSSSWGSGQTSHQYSAAGQYEVSLVVNDGTSLSNPVYSTVTISSPSGLTGSMSCSNQVNIDENVTCNLLTTGGGTVTYSVDFGDGYENGTMSSSAQSVQHQYSTEGTKFITMRLSLSGESYVTSSRVEVFDTTTFNHSNFEILGDGILIVIDDNGVVNAPTNTSDIGADYQNPNSTREVVMNGLHTVAQITGLNWDLHYVGNGTGVASDYNNQSGPSLSKLSKYNVVVWITGAHYYPLTLDDTNNIGTYAAAGGTLIMSSQDLIYGICHDCENFSEGDFLYDVFHVEEVEQDVELGEYGHTENGSSMYNLVYLPTAGFENIKFRSISESYADNISSSNGCCAVGNSSKPMLGSSAGNHLIINRHNGSNTAFFSIDFVQIEHKIDLEHLLLQLINWASGNDVIEENWNTQNAIPIPTGADAWTIVGPLGNNNTDLLNASKSIYQTYVVEGHRYEFSVEGTGSVWIWESTGWNHYSFNASTYFSICNDGPIADAWIQDSSGNPINNSMYCDPQSGKIMLQFTAPTTEKIFIGVQTGNLTGDSTWALDVNLKFDEKTDYSSWDCGNIVGALYHGVPVEDQLSPYGYNYSDQGIWENFEDYSGSCFAVGAVAGETYEIRTNQRSDNTMNMFVEIANWLSGDDVTNVHTDVAWEGESSSSLIFTALNTTTIFVRNFAWNYSNPNTNDGAYSIVSQRLTLPQSSYSNYSSAHEISPSTTLSGYIDGVHAPSEWWSLPVALGERFSISVTVEQSGLYQLCPLGAAGNGSSTWEAAPCETFYGGEGPFTTEFIATHTGTLVLNISASISDGVSSSGSRSNYNLSVSKERQSLGVNQEVTVSVGALNQVNSFYVDLIEGNRYSFLATANSAILQQTPASNLSTSLDLGSGSVTSTFDPQSRIHFLTVTPDESGRYLYNLSGNSGLVSIVVLENGNPDIISSPQRFATALVPFSDQIDANQSGIIGGNWLTSELRYSIEGGPNGLGINSTSGQLSFTPLRSQIGSHLTVINISNAWDGYTILEYTLVISDIPNSAPVVGSLTSTRFTLGQNVQIVLPVSDPDNDSLTFTLLNAPAGATIQQNTGTLSWIPTVAQSFTFTVEIQDSVGHITRWQFDLVGENTAPHMNQLQDFTGDVGTTITHTLAGQDDENHAIHWGLREGPNGMEVSSGGVLNWTPQDTTVGDQFVVLELADEYGASSVSWFKIRVNNTAPVSLLDNYYYNISVGERLYIPMVIDDLEAHPTMAAFSNGPRGVSVYENGDIYWVPDSDQVGTHIIEIVLTDMYGESSVVSLYIAVANKAPHAELLDMWTDDETRHVLATVFSNDEDGHHVNLTCASTNVSVNRRTGGIFELTWDRLDHERSYLAECELIDEYGMVASQDVLFTYDLVTQLPLSLIPVQPSSAGVLTWRVFHPYNLTHLDAFVRVGDALVTATYEEHWLISIYPNDRSQTIVVDVEARTMLGEIFREVIVFETANEITRANCTFEESVINDNSITIGYDCPANVSLLPLAPQPMVVLDSTNQTILIQSDSGITNIDVLIFSKDEMNIVNLLWNIPAEATSDALFSQSTYSFHLTQDQYAIDIGTTSMNYTDCSMEHELSFIENEGCHIFASGELKEGTYSFLVQLIGNDLILDEATVTLHVVGLEEETVAAESTVNLHPVSALYGLVLGICAVLISVLVLGAYRRRKNSSPPILNQTEAKSPPSLKESSDLKPKNLPSRPTLPETSRNEEDILQLDDDDLSQSDPMDNISQSSTIEPLNIIESSIQTGDDGYEYGRSESGLDFYRKDSDADWALWEEEA